MNIVKGQTVWIKGITGLFKNSKPYETTVKSIGRKYITTTYNQMKFHAHTLQEVDYRGTAAHLILDLDKYNTDCYYNKLAIRLGKMHWSSIDRDKIDSIITILELN